MEKLQLAKTRARARFRIRARLLIQDEATSSARTGTGRETETDTVCGRRESALIDFERNVDGGLILEGALTDTAAKLLDLEP